MLIIVLKAFNISYIPNTYIQKKPLDDHTWHKVGNDFVVGQDPGAIPPSRADPGIYERGVYH